LIEEVIGDGDSIILRNIQSLLFVVGCELATEQGKEPFKKLQASDIEMLEKEIDRIDSALPKLLDFVIPGGSKNAAIAHICRTVCRRAERRMCELNELEPVDNLLLIFINRLSDYFFVLARKLCLAEKGEIFWHNACK
jgi:cob(I)alamin adenosyltransferase